MDEKRIINWDETGWEDINEPERKKDVKGKKKRESLRAYCGREGETLEQMLC